MIDYSPWAAQRLEPHRQLGQLDQLDTQDLANTFGSNVGVGALKCVSSSTDSEYSATDSLHSRSASSSTTGPDSPTSARTLVNDNRTPTSGEVLPLESKLCELDVTAQCDKVPVPDVGDCNRNDGHGQQLGHGRLDEAKADVDDERLDVFDSNFPTPTRLSFNVPPSLPVRGMKRSNKPSPLSSATSQRTPTRSAVSPRTPRSAPLTPLPLSPTWVGTSFTPGGVLVPSVSIDLSNLPRFPMPPVPPLPVAATPRRPATAYSSTTFTPRHPAAPLRTSWPWPTLAPVWDRPPSMGSVPQISATYSLAPTIATAVTPMSTPPRSTVKSPLAAWEEDMPRSTPTPSIGTQGTEIFDTPGLLTPSASPLEQGYPGALHNQRYSGQRYSGQSAWTFAEAAPPKSLGMYDDDGELGMDDASDLSSDDDEPIPVRSIGELSAQMLTIGGEDDTTEERAARLRSSFMNLPAAARSHSSLFSQSGARQSHASLHKMVERHSSLDGIAKPTRVVSRDLPELPSRAPTPPPKDDYSGLRSAVLPTLHARKSFVSLDVVPEEPGLRKNRSLGNIRKREKERRKAWLAEPVPEGISSADVFKVSHTKYIRKTMLEPPEPEADEVFSVWRLPSQRRMWEAGTCFLRDENGEVIPFSDLFPLRTGASPEPRTVVFFIRQFWCGMCQDFISGSVAQLDPAVMAAHNIRVVVIGDGPWQVLKSYRSVLNCPFEMYTDGPRHLYHLLGMIKNNLIPPIDTGKAGYNKRPTAVQAYTGIKTAVTNFPFMYPGSMGQLGGEFVFAPGYKCEFAHRMTTMGNHMEAHDVLKKAGVDLPTTPAPLARRFTKEQLARVAQLEEVTRRLVAESRSVEWQNQRNAELDRMRMKKAARRGVASPDPARRQSGWEGYVAENGDAAALGLGCPIDPVLRSKANMDKAFEEAMEKDKAVEKEMKRGMGHDSHEIENGHERNDKQVNTAIGMAI